LRRDPEMGIILISQPDAFRPAQSAANLR
jgi:hypothetical protein